MPDFAKALKQLRDLDRQPYLTGLSGPSPVARLSIATQLQFLRAERSRTYVPVDQPVPARDLLPPGLDQTTPFGRHYVVRQSYDENYYHGKIRLCRFSTDELQGLMSLTKQRLGVCERDRIVFLDTETTGVQSGTGICPFLVGVGHFSGDSFQMIQYFIRDFDEEPSMLYALGDLLKQFDLIITYNGVTFDVPLLETRFTLARLDSPFQRMRHFDLLHPARRLWRQGHGSCRLSALERLLSFMRGPDVPGAMIPRVYFDYVQRRSVPELPGVFTHNVYDVISLAALTLHACDCVHAEPAELDEPLDLYSLARILENSPDWRRAVKLYEMAIKGGLPEPIRIKALEQLSTIYRRAGEHARSYEICRDLMQAELFSFTAYEGAAIYYERVVGNMETALHIIQQGLSRLGEAPHCKRWRSLLRSRWERLQQKVIGFPSLETS